MGVNVNGVFYATTYHPIQAGSIDGTDITAHDNGVYRALLASSAGLYDPLGDPKAEGDPYCSLFVGRLSAQTDEKSLREAMTRYGRVTNLRLVRHIVTGASRGYAFVEFETEKDMHQAYEGAHLSKLDGSTVIVDYNRQQLMPGWIPRRLGGGLGGNKESGQLRFGGRDRPFRAPLRPIPHEELQKLGIPLPPEGHYMTRFQVPPAPQRKYGALGDHEGRYGAAKRKHNYGAHSAEEGDGGFARDHPSSKAHRRGESQDEARDRDAHKRRHEGSWDRSGRDDHDDRDGSQEDVGRKLKRPRGEDAPNWDRDTVKESKYEGYRFERQRADPETLQDELRDGGERSEARRDAAYEDGGAEDRGRHERRKRRRLREGREPSREGSASELDAKDRERARGGRRARDDGSGGGGGGRRAEHKEHAKDVEVEDAKDRSHRHGRRGEEAREGSDHRKHSSKEGDKKHRHRHRRREGNPEVSPGEGGDAGTAHSRGHHKHKHRERSAEANSGDEEHRRRSRHREWDH